MKFFISILFFVVLSPSIFAQSQDTIYWSPGYKLKWDDFHGKPDGNSKFDAVSNPVIKYHLFANEDSFTVKVICFFIKSNSWSKLKLSDTLLMHEQLHFDISELFARELRKAFAEYKFNYSSVGKDIDNLFIINDRERTKMDTQYDNETNYSRNRKVQIAWNKKIKIELNKLQKYSSP